MTTERTMYVQLEQHEHAAAKDLAKARDTTLAKLFAELVSEYAAGPIPPAPKPATPQSELLETRVSVPVSVHEKAKRRARAEGRYLSDAIALLVADELAAQEVPELEPAP